MTTVILGLLAIVDTLVVRPVTTTVRFDGRADSAEYGDATVLIERPAGEIPIWLRQDSSTVIIAVRIADPSYYWGDDFVVSLDLDGRTESAGPGHDDFQWYFRRMLDSSVVLRGEGGRWRSPRDDPDWRLGSERSGGGWEVRAQSDSTGWSLELKLDRAYFASGGTGRSAIAFRVFDDDPQGWFPWPRPARVKQPTEVERRPELWVPVVLAPLSDR